MSATILAVMLGWITYFSPGVMERVAQYRHMSCDGECQGLVAVADCSYLGQVVYLQVEGQVVGPVLSVDCGNAAHREQQKKRQLVGELSYVLWQELGLPNRPVRGEMISRSEFLAWQRMYERDEIREGVYP